MTTLFEDDYFCPLDEEWDEKYDEHLNFGVYESAESSPVFCPVCEKDILFCICEQDYRSYRD